MSDIDAPMRYSDPVADRTGRDGGVGLVVLLALALGAAAIGLAMVSREMAEPVRAGHSRRPCRNRRVLPVRRGRGHPAFRPAPRPQRCHQGLRRQSAARRLDRRQCRPRALCQRGLPQSAGTGRRRRRAAAGPRLCRQHPYRRADLQAGAREPAGTEPERRFSAFRRWGRQKTKPASCRAGSASPSAPCRRTHA